MYPTPQTLGMGGGGTDISNVSLYFYILIIDEKILVLCEKLLSKFSSNLYVLRPLSQKKWFHLDSKEI